MHRPYQTPRPPRPVLRCVSTPLPGWAAPREHATAYANTAYTVRRNSAARIRNAKTSSTLTTHAVHIYMSHAHLQTGRTGQFVHLTRGRSDTAQTRDSGKIRLSAHQHCKQRANGLLSDWLGATMVLAVAALLRASSRARSAAVPRPAGSPLALGRSRADVRGDASGLGGAAAGVATGCLVGSSSAMGCEYRRLASASCAAQ